MGQENERGNLWAHIGMMFFGKIITLEKHSGGAHVLVSQIFFVVTILSLWVILRKNYEIIKMLCWDISELQYIKKMLKV